MHVACEYASTATATMLLARGAKVDARDKFGGVVEAKL